MARLPVFLCFLLLALMGSSSAAPSCPTVKTQLAPCHSYVEGNLKADPSEACCSGLKDILELVKTREDGVSLCNCIKTTVIDDRDIPSRIAELPKKCGLPYKIPPIDKNFDCNKISLN
ncbi:PREDICTED: non-specific lipid-transfer protein-like [Nicotiana attenuata]|uniref:Non-specific lipid-transfer protein n=1 Tax=Nicotiana attenuata TaxID=49451 RepID=A0A314KZC7_NICAT|nr:PREDICTED: non-specific lipid-transfer protein-like [Nicotiana attenuata]OIT34756.1 hypothetical protein A4A49_03434 [Nicotiana attenuata]